MLIGLHMLTSNLSPTNTKTTHSSSSSFNHNENKIAFSNKTKPKTSAQIEFIYNPDDEYHYTYLYKNTHLKRLAESFRRSALNLGLKSDIFEVYYDKDKQWVRISKDHFNEWKDKLENQPKKVTLLEKRIFNFDEDRQVYYTTPQQSETLYSAFNSVKRALKIRGEDCILNETGNEPRIEITIETYQTFNKNTKKDEANLPARPQIRAGAHEREFHWDEASNSYYIFPYAGESIKTLGIVLRESAHFRNLDRAIFSRATKDGTNVFTISHENYHEWVKRCQTSSDHVWLVKRIIEKRDDTFQFILNNNEYSNSLYLTITKFLKRRNRTDIISEIVSDPQSNTISISNKGKMEWDNLKGQLNGRCSTSKNKSFQDYQFVTCKTNPNILILNQTTNIAQSKNALNKMAYRRGQQRIFYFDNDKVCVDKQKYLALKEIIMPQVRTPKTRRKRTDNRNVSRKISYSHKFIATKYLENAKSIKFPLNEDQTPSQLPDATTLHFQPVGDLLEITQRSFYQRNFDLKSGNEVFSIKYGFSGRFKPLSNPDHKMIFIRAGRKLNANIPFFEKSKNECSIILMMSSSELKQARAETPNFYNHLPSNVSLLVIEKVSKNKKNISDDELRTSNIKRKVALLLSELLHLKDYIILDDNITNFTVSSQVTKHITPNLLFDIFRETSKLPTYEGIQKPLCMTVGTYAPHKTIKCPLEATELMPLNPCFGSKWMYINSEEIIALSREKSLSLTNLCSFQDLNWGEDYFHQCALGILANDDRSVIGRLPYKVGFLERAKNNMNATIALSQFKLANQWMKSFDAIQNDPSLSTFQKLIAKEMNEIVVAELARRQALEEARDRLIQSLALEITQPTSSPDRVDNLISDNQPSYVLNLELNKVKDEAKLNGEFRATCGFSINETKLIAETEKYESPTAKDCYVDEFRRAHQSIFNKMSPRDIAIAQGRFHASECSGKFNSRINKNDLEAWASRMGEYKDDYLKSFYDRLSQERATTDRPNIKYS